MDILISISWLLFGFGPSIIILYYGIRALYSDVRIASIDYYDAVKIFDWLIPAFVVVSIGIMKSFLRSSISDMMHYCTTALVVYYIVRYVMQVLFLHGNRLGESLSIKDAVSRVFWLQSWLAGVFIALLSYPEDHIKKFSFEPSTYLFVICMVLPLWIKYLLGRLYRHTYQRHEAEPFELSSGELFDLVHEIATLNHLPVEKIYLTDDLKGAENTAIQVHHDFSNITLPKMYLDRLTKDEVDVLVKHEIYVRIGASRLLKHWFYKLIIIAVFTGAMLLVEKIINDVSPSFYFLHYIKWLSLFIIPPIVFFQFSRDSELESDTFHQSATDGMIFISAMVKLDIINRIPSTRPFWVQAVSRHNTLEQRAQRISSAFGIPNIDIAQIRERAERELRDDSINKYTIEDIDNLPVQDSRKYQPIDINIQPFPNLIIRLILIVVGICQWLLVPFGISDNGTDWVFFMKLSLSTLLMLFLFIGPYVMYKRNERKISNELASRLTDIIQKMYKHAPDESSLIVSFKSSDLKTWQYGFLSIRNGILFLFGEKSKYEIGYQDFHKIFVLDDIDDENNTVVSLDYSNDNDTMEINRLLINYPILPIKSKNSPKSIYQLEEFLIRAVSDSGIEIQYKHKPSLKQIITRVIIAVISMTCLMGLSVIAGNIWHVYILDNPLSWIVVILLMCAFYKWITYTHDIVDENDDLVRY